MAEDTVATLASEVAVESFRSCVDGGLELSLDTSAHMPVCA